MARRRNTSRGSQAARPGAAPRDLGRPIQELLPEVMKSLGLDQRMWEQALLDEWPQIAGPHLARRARPGRLERRTLHVFVSHSAWLSELQRYGQAELLAKLQARFGKDRIERLRLQLDPDITR